MFKFISDFSTKVEYSHLQALLAKMDSICLNYSLTPQNKTFILFINNISLKFLSKVHEFLILCKNFDLDLKVVLRLISYLNAKKNISFIDSKTLNNLKPLIVEILDEFKHNEFFRESKIKLNNFKLLITFRYKSGFKKIRNSKCNFVLLSLLKIVNSQNKNLISNIIYGNDKKSFKDTNKSTVPIVSNKNVVKKETVVNVSKSNDTNKPTVPIVNIFSEMQQNIKKLENSIDNLIDENDLKKNEVFDDLYEYTNKVKESINSFLFSEDMNALFSLELSDPGLNDWFTKVKDFFIFLKIVFCGYDNNNTVINSDTFLNFVKYKKDMLIFTFDSFLTFEKSVIKEIKKERSMESFTDKAFCNIFKCFSKFLNVPIFRRVSLQTYKYITIEKYLLGDLKGILDFLIEKNLNVFAKNFEFFMLSLGFFISLFDAISCLFLFFESTAPIKYDVD